MRRLTGSGQQHTGMSRQHPIIAVTGSSGAGTSSVRGAFEQIFRSEGIKAAIIEGDGFHRHDRETMERVVQEADRDNRNVTHFGPEGNLFEELAAVFREYGLHGTGRHRHYVHNEEEAARRGYASGLLTPWEPLPGNTDLLFYEGMHGGLVTETVNVAKYVDLLIGVVPIINLEWMQKIHRDRSIRGYSVTNATEIILRRIHDYAHYIVPQFSRTDINFQRVPTVDTSNPFAALDIPTDDQSLTVVHVRNTKKVQVDFRHLLEMLEGSFMSMQNTIVVPAGKSIFCMQLIVTPLLQRLVEARE